MKKLRRALILFVPLLAMVTMFLALSGVQAASGPIRNVIFMVGDGMGIGAVTIGRNAIVGQAGRLSFETFPALGLASTYSADNIVTDSAAAGTALATGFKTNNGVIAMVPRKNAQGQVEMVGVKTLLEAAMEAGKSTGLVSTNTVYDATPASFGSHWGTRGGSDAIAAQIFDKKIDVSPRRRPRPVPAGRRRRGQARG